MTVNFFFSSVDATLVELDIQVEVSRHNMEYVASVGPDAAGRQKHDEAMSQSVESTGHVLEACGRLFAHLTCAHIDHAVRKLKWWYDDPNRDDDLHRGWYELHMRSMALRDAIRTELKDYLYYQYPKEKGRKLLTWKEEWKLPLTSFPEIGPDVFSATDCYALEHNTASVFHSMRVAEWGLRALARERQITLAKNKPLEWATWQETIKAIDDEIKIIGSKKPGLTKDAALQFYSGARADLNGFKDEYRNSVMHVRANYDEHQAIRALTTVRAFMNGLAAKIDHTRQRIDWGEF